MTYFNNKGIDIKDEEYELKPLKVNEDLINTETFTMAKLVSNPSFYKAQIEYETNNIYSEENDRPHAVNLMLTDVFGALNNEALVEDGSFEDFFFLLCTDGSSIIELNDPFSMENLVKELHDTNRPQKVGKINGEQIVFGANSMGLSGDIIMRSNANAMQWDLLKPLMSIETNEGFYIIDTVTLTNEGLLTIKIRK